MTLIPLGVEVVVNKEDKKVEEVNVVVLSPLGFSSIPLDEYIVLFVDSPIELMDLMVNVEQALSEVDEEIKMSA